MRDFLASLFPRGPNISIPDDIALRVRYLRDAACLSNVFYVVVAPEKNQTGT